MTLVELIFTRTDTIHCPSRGMDGTVLMVSLGIEESQLRRVDTTIYSGIATSCYYLLMHIQTMRQTRTVVDCQYFQ